MLKIRVNSKKDDKVAEVLRLILSVSERRDEFPIQESLNGPGNLQCLLIALAKLISEEIYAGDSIDVKDEDILFANDSSEVGDIIESLLTMMVKAEEMKKCIRMESVKDDLQIFLISLARGIDAEYRNGQMLQIKEVED